MTDSKRVFILGAGFSKPAGMPLATELLPLLFEKLQLEEMQEWLDGLRDRMAWLDGDDPAAQSTTLNIEQVFHCAHFDAEVFRLRQQLCQVGRGDGPGTPWSGAESIAAWLSYMEEALQDVIVEMENCCDTASIKRWATEVTPLDSVITFNYDTLVERSLMEIGKAWNHGTARDRHDGMSIYKLHGSIDWIVAHRAQTLNACDLLFDKENTNRSEQNTGHVEDDYRLWRCRSRDQLITWIEHRDLQVVPEGAVPNTVGIAGLGAYKQLHEIPGLGQAWANGMKSLYEAETAIVVGFSMSDFDAMAQLQFAEVARTREEEGRPLRVTVIDPFTSQSSTERFQRVFRSVSFVTEPHETIDWSIY